MALGHSTLSESGWSSTPNAQPKFPPLPPSHKRKTLKMADSPGKVVLTYSMSIQTPKGAPDVITDVTVGQMKINITPTATPGWSMLTVEVAVDKT